MSAPSTAGRRSGNTKLLAVIAGVAVVIFLILGIAAACVGGDDGDNGAASDVEQSEQVDGWLRSFYGIDSWQDFDGGPGHSWQNTVSEMEVSGSVLTVRLGMHPGNPDTERLGAEAATTIAQQIRANEPPEADGIRTVRAEDDAGGRLAEERI